jgi:Asp-tRNA(Asn)/Glu-tRNA(Gln) amidotransferase A subunit family amidase
LVTNVAVDVEGFATSGVLTRTVADTAAALDVLARHDPAAWWFPPTPRSSFTGTMTTAPPFGLRIGVRARSARWSCPRLHCVRHSNPAVALHWPVAASGDGVEVWGVALTNVAHQTVTGPVRAGLQDWAVDRRW